MPRIKRGLGPPPVVHPELATALVEELRNERAFGQPTIDEQHFPETGAIRVMVVWDRWEGLSDAQRMDVILAAYEQAEGAEVRKRIALAIGVTVPEAADSGLLPYQIQPLLRRSDGVTAEQCNQAMLEQGASLLRNANIPELRFSTLDEADRALQRLNDNLPGVWTVIQELSHAS